MRGDTNFKGSDSSDPSVSILWFSLNIWLVSWIPSHRAALWLTIYIPVGRLVSNFRVTCDSFHFRYNFSCLTSPRKLLCVLVGMPDTINFSELEILQNAMSISSDCYCRVLRRRGIQCASFFEPLISENTSSQLTLLS